MTKFFVVLHPFVNNEPVMRKMPEWGPSYRSYRYRDRYPEGVCSPVQDKIEDRNAAFEGHKCGPFSWEVAEQAAVAALGTGKFYQVELVEERK